MVPASTDSLPGRLAQLASGRRLLEALEQTGLTGVHLVGGAVRDLLLGGRTPQELDLVAERDGPGVARRLAAALGGEFRVHAAFATATVQTPDLLRIDVATARAEEYPRPGALPVVRAGTLQEDMGRRDFTVNAIAVGISPDRRGTVHRAPQALEDLEAGRLRVLHGRSFSDDPTRLLRLARYAARLRFTVDEATRRLACEAFAADAPGTAGPARMGAELLLLLAEPEPVRGLALLRDLGGLPTGWRLDEPLLERALALLPAGGRGDAVLLAGLGAGMGAAGLSACLSAMHVPAPEVVAAAHRDPAGLAEAMRTAPRDSALHRLLRGRPPEAVALAGAHGAQEAARRWLDRLRHVRLEIGGEDLLRAGVPQGPEVGRRLEAALERKLDEGLEGREAELAAALEDA
jgi:tRNA nucleotidyltransferase (CCA-adding enzyme)